MLAKITDDLFIDVQEILYIEKKGKDIGIIFKNNHRYLLSVYTNEGKCLLKALNEAYMNSLLPKDIVNV